MVDRPGAPVWSAQRPSVVRTVSSMSQIAMGCHLVTVGHTRPPMARELDEYLTAKEIACLLRVSVRTFWRWEQLGMVPGRTAIGRKALFRRSSVETWLRSREQVRESTPAPVAKPTSAKGWSKAPVATERRRPKPK